MASLIRSPMLAILCAATIGSTVQAQQPIQPPAGADRVIGTWQGLLARGSFRERIAFIVSRGESGAIIGLMKSLDQGRQTPAVVSVRADTFDFAIPADHITYSGIISAAGDSVRGTLAQAGHSFSLSFGRASAGASFTRPQDPKPPFPYRATDMIIPSVDGVRLAGTVIIPDGSGPFPAVVFVTGSGPQDRDETILGHHPFLVIADYLARHGIASLRYDDRGFAKSTGNFNVSTSADFANDAEAAVHFLQHVQGIAPNRVGIIGHSEGALIGPMVAARSRDVAFLVLLAGPGMPGDSLSLLQLRAQAGGSVPPARLDAALATNARLYAAITGGRDSADAVARLMGAKDSLVAAMPQEDRAAAAARIDKTIPSLVTPWMRFFLRYDSRTALRKVRVPVLALGGSLDEQVPAQRNLAGIESALKAGGDTDYQTVELPGLNHLFQTATTGAPAEYATIDETIAPHVLEVVTQWIRARFAGR